MKKIANILLITIVFLTITILVGFILGQSANITNKATIKNSYVKNMTNLIVKNNLKDYGIEVISSIQANFGVELKQYTGDEEGVNSLIEVAKPLTIFIENNSSKEVIGVSLRWRFVKSNGEFIEIPQTQINPGVLMGLKPRDPWMIGKTSLINKNDTRFFSYFNTTVEQEIVYANMRHSNPEINYNQNTSLEEMQRNVALVELQKSKILDNVSEISVSIDGIFFDDGAFVGDDQNYFFDSMKGMLQARKDFLGRLKEAKASGKEDSEILSSFLADTPNILSRYSEKSSKTEYSNRQEAFETYYKGELLGLKREISMKRSRMSDDTIVNNLQTVKESDFIMVRKLNQ